MDFAEAVKSTRKRKCLVRNVLPDTYEFETAQKPILDLERLRRLADIARPLRDRVQAAESAAIEDRVDGGQSAEPAGKDRNRAPSGAPRRARNVR